MSDNQKCFTGTLVATRDVTVFADSPEEAAETIRRLYESGDDCAEVGEVDVTDVRQTDVEGNEYLDVYLFFDDETATMMDTPVLRVPPNTQELTDEMVREILVDCLGHQESNEKYIPLAAGWDRNKMADAMYALCCLILNNAALIEPKHAETISKVSDALGDCCGGDSSTYNACKASEWDEKSVTLCGIAGRCLGEPTFQSIGLGSWTGYIFDYAENFDEMRQKAIDFVLARKQIQAEQLRNYALKLEELPIEYEEIGQ